MKVFIAMLIIIFYSIVTLEFLLNTQPAVRINLFKTLCAHYHGKYTGVKCEGVPAKAKFIFESVGFSKESSEGAK